MIQNETVNNPEPVCPVFRKTIGQTTYVVKVHFSETNEEMLEDKIKRLLREEVRRM